MKKQTRNLIIIIGVVVVLVGALLAVIFLVPNSSTNTDVGSVYPTDANGHEYAVDAKGNRIEAETSIDGKVISAGIVTLTNKVPADLATVNIINDSGDFTIKAETPIVETTEPTAATDSSGKSTTTASDATVYTLVGYEDYTLDSASMSAIGNDAASVTTTKIVDINGENPEDYGLTKPRATINVTYIDGSTAVIKVGNEAPAVGEGTYVMVNDDKAIYLVANESVDSFFYNPAQMMDKNITTAAESDDNTNFSTITLGGTHLDKEVVIEPDDDDTNNAYYKITSPIKSLVSVEEGSSIIGGIRGLTADQVVAVNPTDSQLEEYGLKNPYATAKGVYPDATYTLKASKPDEDSFVYLMCDDLKLVYKVATSKVTWVDTTLEKLQYEYILKPKLETVSSIDVAIGSKTYTFKTTTATTTDEDGNETTATTATYNDEDLNTTYFQNYFESISSATKGGTDNISGDSEIVKITYHYNTGKSADTVAFYSSDTTKVQAKVNGENSGFVYSKYTDKVISDTEKMAENKKI